MLLLVEDEAVVALGRAGPWPNQAGGGSDEVRRTHERRRTHLLCWDKAATERTIGLDHVTLVITPP
ncbi:MAG: hypothetical protein JNL79_31185 [Myxococcales bacterium]|nr:hypothetical protein [Myxococcales bacterium]